MQRLVWYGSFKISLLTTFYNKRFSCFSILAEPNTSVVSSPFVTNDCHKQMTFHDGAIVPGYYHYPRTVIS